MSQIINSNIPSLNTQLNLDRSKNENEQALERLSSGLRINGAGDDPSGIAIATRLGSQIDGLDSAVRNANDGVSLAQTAEGALGSMTDSLQRIRELALQSANATNTPQDRQSLNQEVQTLKDELNRVSQETQFNGTKLLDGSFDGAFYQIGANSGETIDVNLVGSSLDNMGSIADDGLTSAATNQDMSDGDLRINGVAIDAPRASSDTSSTQERDQSAIARAAAVNDKSTATGVRAEANETSLAGSKVSAPLPADDATVKINGVTMTLTNDSTKTPEEFLSDVAETINSEMDNTGVEASFSGNPDEGISLTASDGRNITVDFSDSTNDSNTIAKDELAQAFGLADTDPTNNGSDRETFRGTYSLISKDGSDITLDSDGDISSAGFQSGTFSGTNSGAVSRSMPGDAMNEGDLVLNGVAIRESSADDDTASPSTTNPETSAIAKAAAINADSDETGVVANANPTVLTAKTIEPPDTSAGADDSLDGSFRVNGTTIQVKFGDDSSVEERQKAIVGAVNARSGTTGVRAEAFTNTGGDKTFRLIAENGRNVSVSDFENIDGGSYTAANFGFEGSAANPPASAQTQRASLSLQSAGRIEIETEGDPSNAGFTTGNYGNDEASQLMRYVDISTTEGANEAIVAVDNALDQVNSQRAGLGAIQNRFESTITNQRSASENLNAAKSRIEDADFAKESSELSRTQVLQSAGLSILTQANQQPQQVLQLLQG